MQSEDKFKIIFSKELRANKNLSIASEPISSGFWAYADNSQCLGEIYFNLKAIGDTSSILEVGIVSSTSPNPDSSNDSQVVNFGDGIAYKTGDGLKYFRAYALESNGEYHYSDSPGILFNIPTINRAHTQVYRNGNSFSYTIKIKAEIENLFFSNLDDWGLIMNVGESTYDDLQDPYWCGIEPSDGINKPPDTLSMIENNVILGEWSDVGGLDTDVVYLRAYIVKNGIKYWSKLLWFYL